MVILESCIVKLKLRSVAIVDDDESAARDVLSALSKCAYLPVRGLTCEYGPGVVIVKGRLPSFYLKQVAIAIVLHNLSAETRFDDVIEVN